MMYSEFEVLCKAKKIVSIPNVDTYREIIEVVYAFHPSIKDVGGKEQIVDILKKQGMIQIEDMYHRAKAISDAEGAHSIAVAQFETAQIELKKNIAEIEDDAKKRIAYLRETNFAMFEKPLMEAERKMRAIKKVPETE